MGVYYVRRGLEGEAARLFVMRATNEEKQMLVELNRDFDDAATHELPTIDEFDIALHVHIARGAHCGHLYELIANSHIETIAILGSSIMLGGIVPNGSNNLGCHARLVEALLGSDPEAARRELVTHIDSNLETYHQLHLVSPATAGNSISTFLKLQVARGQIAPIHQVLLARPQPVRIAVYRLRRPHIQRKQHQDDVAVDVGQHVFHRRVAVKRYAVMPRTDARPLGRIGG